MLLPLTVMDSATALREFLEYIIGQLIAQPEEGAIAHELSEDGKHHKFLVTLTKDDVGKIVGKNGHTPLQLKPNARIPTIGWDYLSGFQGVSGLGFPLE